MRNLCDAGYTRVVIYGTKPAGLQTTAHIACHSSIDAVNHFGQVGYEAVYRVEHILS